ncbi:septum site-determining protein MinC [Spartinivicinus poritis]|uniref:Probable septum site-determining protein MinC n=1 Tax=Spartinivicinus poritis TaxID=2994640 RepID=A0ABT5U7H7_9GAMM|nr:septum site-determining protein MinC [Spartinivicinus sp. A2-2]MDE1462326.1 septum site-determining protein MinC [Spartinivicinus sp. A2-2]
MTTNATFASKEDSCFQLKTSRVNLTSIDLYRYQPEKFVAALSEKVEQAPNFFKQTPVIINLAKCINNHNLDLLELRQQCANHGLQVVAFRSDNIYIRQAASSVGLAWLPEEKATVTQHSSNHHQADNVTAHTSTSSTTSEACTKGTLQPELPSKQQVATKFITHPVRSGQQLLAPEGDLVVVAPVSAGAELLAAGHIHVYGPLRGRALAGINGNREARIFCQRFEPELIAIAGCYQVDNGISRDQWQQPVQVVLSNEELQIIAL